MRHYLAISLALLALLLTPAAQAVNSSQGITLSGRMADAPGIPIASKGFGIVTFQVCCGSFGGTISFLASLDGFNFEPLGCVPITGNPATDARVTSATARGIWRCDITGLNTYVRADLSGYSFGTITVPVQLTER